MKINHANRFFKEVTRLWDLASHWNFDKRMDLNEDRELFSLNHEEYAKDCTRRADGSWESIWYQYGHYRRRFIFIWREFPNYCCAGKPYYTWSQQTEYLEKSETEKILYEYKGLEFIWMWDEIIPPTYIVWGMKSGPKKFMLRKDGVILVEPTTVKKHFREAVAPFIEQVDYVPPSRDSCHMRDINNWR
jgi:hypothetical protein